MPSSEDVSRYVSALKQITHNFFVGSPHRETFHIVVVTRPGNRCRIWLMSSARPDNAPELEPLRKLLLAVKPMDIREGPTILALSGTVAGGDGSESLEGEAYQRPVPAEWRALAKTLRDPPIFSSDAFLDLLWPPNN